MTHLDEHEDNPSHMPKEWIVGLSLALLVMVWLLGDSLVHAINLHGKYHDFWACPYNLIGW